MKPVVIMDVDEVLADFVGAVIEVANNLKIDPEEMFEREDVDQWSIKDALDLADWEWEEVRRCISRPGFARELAVLDGAIDGMRELKKFATIVIATSPWHSDTWVSDREVWLAEHFDGLYDAVIYTHHKEFIRGDFIVDDRTKHVGDWLNRKSGHTGSSWWGVYDRALLWDKPHNAQDEVPFGVRRIDGWESLCDLIRTMWGVKL